MAQAAPTLVLARPTMTHDVHTEHSYNACGELVELRTSMTLRARAYGNPFSEKGYLEIVTRYDMANRMIKTTATSGRGQEEWSKIHCLQPAEEQMERSHMTMLRRWLRRRDRPALPWR